MSKFDKDLLTPCPILRPTEAEFMDPIGYLSSSPISELGKKYGIVKIVPPEDWKPSFQISPSFKFHVRQQVISDLGITTRSRKFFRESINRFLNMRRKRLLKLSFKVDGHKIYYYDLYVLVEKLGGFQALDKSIWQEVNKTFGVDPKSRVIEMEYNASIKYYASFLKCNKSVEFPESDSDSESENCLICGDNDNPQETLLCDHCDHAFHMKCLNPPLSQIPATNWYCDKCLVGTGDYGFEEHPEIKYSIPEFYKMCQEFDENFAKDYNESKKPTLDELEEKFWSFVDVEKSDLEVLYGADIHNLKPGEISGFPMANTPSIDLANAENRFYINHPYNLTKLPFAKGSLLNYINTSISGMTVPWIYIGSLLSTFCWHVEDHYTLSANYCHFGATKKWYGIPSSHADQFEMLMRKSAPDLFKKQPDLLHQLVTLINPAELVRHGIPCVYADQGPREFVITYPKVYHAGFNSGFNFNEAVNFAMDDWLEFGERSVHDYRPIKKEDVFNYYELVENILKDFNHHSKRGNLSLAKRSIDVLERFLNDQEILLRSAKLKNMEIEYRPKAYKKRQFDLEQKGEIEDEVEDLCFKCKTHLGYQYCELYSAPGEDQDKSICEGIKHERSEYEQQLPTPEISPQEEVVRDTSSTDASTLSESASSIQLQAIAKAKCVMDEYDILISQAKKRSCEPEEESDSKRRKSRRLRSLEEEQFQKKAVNKHVDGKMKGMKRTKHRAKIATESRRVCLKCILDLECVPTNTKLIYQSYPQKLRQTIDDAKANVNVLQSV
ncbi:hypothetical protein CANMA_005125 [Candida margitis]|uniref:uncharacterized protein n=1 Tax=Candida margitis TaxID=1775924 RepID=UPI002227C1DF|nr:uncharacterized protein CANMA_005125 [Candida margitis]KAI5952046.1 hypothetical protein CANMA_005125 [Candida margitis]